MAKELDDFQSAITRMSASAKFPTTVAVCFTLLLAWVLFEYWPASAIGIQLAPQSFKNETNWSFVLRSGDSHLLIERENHSDMAWLSDGTSITNEYQSGMTTMTPLKPGATWNFNATIPSNATAVQVTIYCHATSKLQWGLYEMFNKFGLDRLNDLLARLASPRQCIVRSSIWIKDGSGWTERTSESKPN